MLRLLCPNKTTIWAKKKERKQSEPFFVSTKNLFGTGHDLQISFLAFVLAKEVDSFAVCLKLVICIYLPVLFDILIQWLTESWPFGLMKDNKMFTHLFGMSHQRLKEEAKKPWTFSVTSL